MYSSTFYYVPYPIIAAPPSITSFSLNSTTDILEGQSFQIICQAEGFPEPTYEVS